METEFCDLCNNIMVHVDLSPDAPKRCANNCCPRSGNIVPLREQDYRYQYELKARKEDLEFYTYEFEVIKEMVEHFDESRAQRDLSADGNQKAIMVLCIINLLLTISLISIDIIW